MRLLICLKLTGKCTELAEFGWTGMLAEGYFSQGLVLNIVDLVFVLKWVSMSGELGLRFLQKQVNK